MVKYIDFGLSLQIDNVTPYDYGMAGTPSYMAPEMVLKLPYTLAVDCWSLGVMIFQLLTGAESTHPFILACAQCNDDSSVDPFDAARPALPGEEANALLGMLLQSDPKERASANEVTRHLTFTRPMGTGRRAP